MNKSNLEEFNPHSRLFQRVKAPTGVHNPYAFGGGGSGLDAAAANKIAQVFAWDYMGAAEFEFGAAGRVLQTMQDNIATYERFAFRSGDTVFYGLAPKQHTVECCQLWAQVLAGPQATQEPLEINNPEIIGWFDFENAWFMARTAEFANQVRKLFGPD